MATIIIDTDAWEAIIAPSVLNADERDLWGVILNEQTIQRLSNRTLYTLRRLEALTGSEITGVQVLGTRGLADVSSSLPSEGWVLRYRDGRYVPEQLPEGGITVLENGTQDKPESLTVAEREVGDVADYTALVNCSLERVSSPASVGTHSLRLRAATSGPMSAVIVRKIPVVAGTLWLASGQTRANTITRESRIGFRWFDDTDTLIETTYGDQGLNSSTAWTTFDVEAVAPTNAVSVQLVVEILAVGTGNEDHFVDNFSVNQALTSRSNLNITGIPVTDNPELDAVSLDFTAFVDDVMTTLNDAVQDVQDLADQLEIDVEEAITDINNRADALEAQLEDVAFEAAILFGGGD